MIQRISRLLCYLGIHVWSSWDVWYPGIDAPVVERYDGGRECVRCGKIVADIQYRDK